jgi:hypothetical protein
LKRRPQIKKEEPNDEEYEQQQPGTSAASAKEKPKQSEKFDCERMELKNQI